MLIRNQANVRRHECIKRGRNPRSTNANKPLVDRLGENFLVLLIIRGNAMISNSKT